MVTSENIIQVKDLTKVFDSGVVALDHCDLNIRKGEVVAIIGPSGSGKSTLLRSLNLLETPTSGSILFEGVDLANKKVNINLHRQKMGMVFQHFNLFPHKTVLENITMAPVQLKKMTKPQAKEKAMGLLERIGLADKANTYPNMLSGGQKQRISIARIFLKNPPVLILDEATSALDNESEKHIQTALHELSQGRTTLVIAHRLSTIRHADKIIAIEDGRIAEIGTHAELLQNNGIYAKYHQMQFGCTE